MSDHATAKNTTDGTLGSGIKVVPRSGNEIPYPNCLVIDTSSDSGTIMATVEHFQESRTEGGFPWKIEPVNDQPLPFDVAIDLATRYAEDNGVPVILVNQEGLSSDQHKQQTDTEIIDMSHLGKVE